MSKGGSTTSSVTIPEYIEAAAQRNLNKAERISQIGYTPYYGPDVAAFTPMQQAAFQGTAQTAGAFGLPGGSMSQQDIMGGMPTPTTYAGGVQGYSAAPIYEQSLQTLGQRRPGQKAYIDSFFIDPYAGGAAAGNFAPIDYTGYATAAEIARNAGDGGTPSSTDYTAPGGTSSGGSQGIYAVPGYTTYGGHRDIAHEAIDQSFVDYGKSITAGTARPEDNPSYNAGVAASNQNAPVTFTNPAGQTITKPASQITSSDFEGVDPKTASQLAAASMLSAGISNVGGGFSQDDPTTGFTGGVRDAFGNLVENAADFPIPTPTGLIAQAIDAPNSTYTPTGTGGNSGNSDQARALAAMPTAPSFAIGGSLAAETDAIASDLSEDEFWEMAANDPTVGAALNMPTTPAPTIDDLRTPGSSTLGVNKSDTQAVGAVSDDGNWQAVVNPGTNAITRQWVGDSSSSNDSGGGSSSSGGTVLCTAYASMGYLPADIWSLDTRYGIKRFRQDPVMVSGYRLWAAPIARFIKTDTLAARATRAVLWPVVRAWAEEMAHTMKPQKYSGNKFGKLIMAMGEPFSYAVGATFLKRNAQKEL